MAGPGLSVSRTRLPVARAGVFVAAVFGLVSTSGVLSFGYLCLAVSVSALGSLGIRLLVVAG